MSVFIKILTKKGTKKYTVPKNCIIQLLINAGNLLDFKIEGRIFPFKFELLRKCLDICFTILTWEQYIADMLTLFTEVRASFIGVHWKPAVVLLFASEKWLTRQTYRCTCIWDLKVDKTKSCLWWWDPWMHATTQQFLQFTYHNHGLMAFRENYLNCFTDFNMSRHFFPVEILYFIINTRWEHTYTTFCAACKSDAF